MKERKGKENFMLSNYEIDNIWMSYRYCIGRHTIASYAHAGDIAVNSFGRMENDRMIFMSEDINSEIYDHLHYNNFFNINDRWRVPKEEFRPLDVFYQALNELGLKTIEDFRELKSIEAEWTDNGWKFYFEECQNIRNMNERSIYDIFDLDVWQKLANLFSLNTHKTCECANGEKYRYFEYWTHTFDEERRFKFLKRKAEVDAISITNERYLDEQYIINENV